MIGRSVGNEGTRVRRAPYETLPLAESGEVHAWAGYPPDDERYETFVADLLGPPDGSARRSPTGSSTTRARPSDRQRGGWPRTEDGSIRASSMWAARPVRAFSPR